MKYLAILCGLFLAASAVAQTPQSGSSGGAGGTTYSNITESGTTVTVGGGLTVVGTTTAGAVSATSAVLSNVIGLGDGLTNSSGYRFADTNALVAGDTASTNYTVTATNTSAGYVRTITAGTTNYVIDATNTSAAYARSLIKPQIVGWLGGGGTASVGTSVRYLSFYGTGVSQAAATGVELSIGRHDVLVTNFIMNVDNVLALTGTNVTLTIVTNGVNSTIGPTLVGNGSLLGATNITTGLLIPAYTKVCWQVVGTNPQTFAPNLGVVFDAFIQ